MPHKNKEERAAYGRKYRQMHKEKLATYFQKYHMAHKEKKNAYARKYHQEHKEEIHARCKKYRQLHREEGITRCRKYYQEHKEEFAANVKKYRRIHKEKTMNNYLVKSYGITLEDYNKMFLDQGGACAICGKVQNGKNLAVDHDHKTGKIRKLLCYKCNALLGMAEDSTGILLKAINYLGLYQSAVAKIFKVKLDAI